jgi:hypothetical protein
LGICVGERLLDRVDGQQGEIGFLLGMVDEVDVDKLLDFEIGRCDILDHRREKGECLLRTVHHLYGEIQVSSCQRAQPTGQVPSTHRNDASQAVEDISFVAAVEELLDLVPVEEF